MAGTIGPAPRQLTKSGNDIARNDDGTDLIRVILVARRPNPGFGPVHRRFAAYAEPVFDVEAGAAELGYPRGDLHLVAEFHRDQEIGVGVDQRNADDAEGV